MLRADKAARKDNEEAYVERRISCLPLGKTTKKPSGIGRLSKR